MTGLTAGTSYDCEVVASNWCGAAVLAVATATTFARAPNVPAGLAAGTLLAVTTLSIAVSWVVTVVDSAHDAPASYTLQYRMTGGGAWTQITGITETTQTVTGLSAGTGYDFRVEAVNAGGASGFTATANKTTYAVTIALNYVSPSPFPHGGYPGVNATMTPTPASVPEGWRSSGKVEPTSGWTNGSNYSGSMWGCYLGGGASAAAGTGWLWLEAQNSSGATIGLSMTGPYTVT